MKYYIARNNQPVGPFDLSRLRDEGVTADTLLWCQGMTRWTPACEITEVMDAIGSSDPESHESEVPQPETPEIPLPPTFDAARFCQGNGIAPAPDNRPMYQHRPDNYMAEAILVCVLCCFVPGIIAIIQASKVNSRYDSGDYEGAVNASKGARNWVIGSVLVGMFFWFMVFQLSMVSHFESMMQSMTQNLPTV